MFSCSSTLLVKASEAVISEDEFRHLEHEAGGGESV